MQEKLNVLMNAFGMPVRKRIIEETLRPFRVGTCISVLPSCDDLPDLGADQFICHREQDAHDNIDWTGFRPIDEELIEGMRHCEMVFIDMLGRQEWNGRTLTYTDRKRTYLQMLRYWNHMLEEHRINLFLSMALPHRIRTYLLYDLCRYKGIPTLFFFHAAAIEGECFLLENWEESSPELKATFARLRETYGSTNDPVPLSPPYEAFYTEQVQKGENAPPPWHVLVEDEGPKVRRRQWWQMFHRTLREDLPRFSKLGVAFFVNRMRREYWKFFLTDRARKCAACDMFRFYDEHTTEPDLTRPFVYVPLHLQPEASTLPLGGAYSDQLLIVQMLAALLPKDVLLYVKENPGQQKYAPDGMGRDMAFYKDLLAIPRVRLVPRTYSSYRLIAHAVAAATVTGSAAFESIVRGKPALVFGHFAYQYAPGVFPVHSSDDCKKALHAIFERKEKPNLRDVRIYLKALQDVSLSGYYDERRTRIESEEADRIVRDFSAALIRKIREKFPALS